ncbi:Origin recognition complex subunit 5 [Gossypium arboreum]|uniref:Origin recognition complex subunit 5 n=1 Tax=Gossypium arboreum TaxID=29729 RepID=A0A0B0N3N8_GOSAR|nr:Origin recognition complex subunit 5 [Gossypium arboreum]
MQPCPHIPSEDTDPFLHIQLLRSNFVKFSMNASTCFFLLDPGYDSLLTYPCNVH